MDALAGIGVTLPVFIAAQALSGQISRPRWFRAAEPLQLETC
jgi:hypothetical protein